jgi:hypothetical protein
VRLAVLEHGHAPEQAAVLEEMRRTRGDIPDVRKLLLYRPALFGGAFSEALHAALRAPSPWTAGERELFAAYVSAQNRCPY